MKIKDIISKPVCYISPNTTLKEAAKLMKEKNVGVLPVAENDRLIGMLTDRDIVIHALAYGKGDNISAKEAMCNEVLYCFEDDSLEELAKNLGKNQIRRLPVLNRDKRLVGIVSLGDLTRRGSKELAAQALYDICAPSLDISGA